MGKEVNKSMGGLFIALRNLLSDLLRKHPITTLILFGIIGYLLRYFISTPNKIIFCLSLIVSFVSVIIFTQTKKYGETLLPFMIGILTIFTVNWDHTKADIFIIFYLIVNLVIFLISSLNIASKIESQLTTAASYIDQKEFEIIYKQLNDICKKGTNNHMLSRLESAEALKYLAYANVKVVDMPVAILNIEMVKVVYGLTLKQACDFYRSIYFVNRRTKNNIDINQLLEIIFVKALPITPEEFINVFDKTKKVLINQEMDIVKYLDKLESLLLNGYTNDYIVISMNKPLND